MSQNEVRGQPNRYPVLFTAMVNIPFLDRELEQYVNEAIAAEREACAEIALRYGAGTKPDAKMQTVLRISYEAAEAYKVAQACAEFIASGIRARR